MCFLSVMLESDQFVPCKPDHYLIVRKPIKSLMISPYTKSFLILQPGLY